MLIISVDCSTNRAFHLKSQPNERKNKGGEAIVTWVESKVPEFEEKVEAGETLAFLDEAGFSMKPTITRTWATRGETPVLDRKTKWEKVSTIGAITTNGQFLQQNHVGAIKGHHVVAFCKHLLRQVPGNITVILDHARIHKTKALSAFILEQERLSLEYLPPYSPELNPIELVWAYMKQHFLANFCPPDLPTLKTRLTKGWACIRSIDLSNRLLYGSAA